MPRKSAEATAPATEDISPVDDVLAILKEPVPDEQISERQGWRDRSGNPVMVKYVEWHTVADILDAAYPEWTNEIKSVSVIGGVVYCVVALTIAGITREGIGTGGADSEMGVKKAEHDGLKRAAVKFGVGRELYHKEEGQYEQSAGGYSGGGGYGGGGGQFTNEKPADPWLRNQQDAPSDKQTKMVWAICKDLGYDQDTKASQLFEYQCTVAMLNRKAVSYMIDQLKKEQEALGGAPAMTGAPPVPPVTQQLPPGVTQGMPPQAPAMPPMPPQQPASVQQGQFVDVNTKNSLRILCQKKGQDEVAIASRFTGGRAKTLDEMSQAEATAAHDAIASM